MEATDHSLSSKDLCEVVAPLLIESGIFADGEEETIQDLCKSLLQEIHGASSSSTTETQRNAQDFQVLSAPLNIAEQVKVALFDTS